MIIKQPQVASAKRPLIRGLIHKLVYIFKNQNVPHYIQAFLWIQQPQMASAERPRPHTHTNLHTLKYQSASSNTNLSMN